MAQQYCRSARGGCRPSAAAAGSVTRMSSTSVAATFAFVAGLGGAVQVAVQGRLGDRIGSLEPGQEADFTVLDAAATPLLARRTAGASLHARLFALQVLGDDRAVACSYVAGKLAHRRDGGNE